VKLKLITVVAVSIGLLVGAFLFAHVSPVVAIETLVKGAFGSPSGWTGTLKEMTPLLIAGIAVFVALKAGLFNIGVEGQLLMGAITASYVGLQVTGVCGVALALVSGMVAGLIWALPAGLIKAYRNGHEVITTIMLNNVATQLTLWLANGPLRDMAQQNPRTAMLDQSTRLPSIELGAGFHINWAIVLGVTLLTLTAIWLKRTVSGFELRATGGNPKAAAFAGINTQRTVVTAMCVSGALGGLTGALQVLAFEFQFYDGFSPGYGFDALGVALLAGNSVWAILPSAFLFGALNKGSSAMQAMLGVPKGITYIVIGVLIVIYAIVRYRKAVAHD
jgi:simple sugar transport system permease protein